MSRSSILHLTETALTDVLKATQAGTPLAACNVLAGQSVDLAAPVEYPALTISASLPVALDYPPTTYELKVLARIETSINEEADANSVHPARVTALRDFLECFDQLAARVNALSPNFNLSALAFETEQQLTADQAFMTEITYYAGVMITGQNSSPALPNLHGNYPF